MLGRMLRVVVASLVLVGCTASSTPAEHRTHSGVTPEILRQPNVCSEVVVAQHAACAVHWDEGCDAVLLDAAYRKSVAPARTGTCYYHDRATCPDCACELYLKVKGQGFDGGTGCLPDRAQLLAQLRGACAEQRCEP